MRNDENQSENVQNVTPAAVTQPTNDALLQRMEQLENELKTLKAQGVIAKPQKPTAQRATRSNRSETCIFNEQDY